MKRGFSRVVGKVCSSRNLSFVDRRRALDAEDMKKVFARLLQSDAVTPAMRSAQELFILMFLLRGLPFVDLAYLRKSDLRGNVISYRRRKTGRPLSVTLTSEAMFLLRKYMSREEQDVDKRQEYHFRFNRRNNMDTIFDVLIRRLMNNAPTRLASTN